jgi:hypothetical protein
VFDIQLPNITAPTESGKIQQLCGYLFQLAEKLNWSLNTLENSGGGGITAEIVSPTGAKETVKVETFNELKALIISSADIVAQYATAAKNIYDGSGAYVAQSDFGTYKEERRAILTMDEATGATLLMTKDAEIEGESERTYKGCIKIGDVTVAGDDDTVYGVSVGQVTEVNGIKKFTTSARFTSSSLEFYDAVENRIAYILTDSLGDSRFFIEDAEITSTLTIGHYVIDASGGGLAFTWKEG